MEYRTKILIENIIINVLVILLYYKFVNKKLRVLRDKRITPYIM